MRIILTSLLFVSIFAFSSCDSNSSQEVEVEKIGEEIQKDWQDARNSMKAELTETRKEIDKKIKEIDANLEKAGDKNRDRWEAAKESLNEMGEQVDEKMEKIEKSTESNFEKTQTTVKDWAEDTNDKLSEMSDDFKDWINQ